MNKRIRELVRESHLDMYALGKDRDKWESVIDKFAELIVQECKDIAFIRGDNVDYLSLQLINNEVDDAKDALRAYDKENT